MEYNDFANQHETEPKPGHSEGPVARDIEQQTAKLPSDIFLWAQFLPFALCLVSSAQSIQQKLPSADAAKSVTDIRIQRDAVQLQNQEYVFPQFVVGGEWTSTIKLTNRGTRPLTEIPVVLIDNTGKPMRATVQLSDGRTITDSSFTATLPVGALVEAIFEGGRDTQFGHAFIGCPATGACETTGLYGEVTLRNRNSTRPDFESIFPIEQPAQTQYLLFDGRIGFTTLLYLVNPKATDTGVTLEIVDTSNKVLRSLNLTLRAGGSELLTLHVLSAETVGIQGTVVIRATNSGVDIVATGLRITPSNSFTPIRAFVPPR